MMLYCFFVPQAISKDCWDNLSYFFKHLAQLLKLLQSVCMVHGKHCTEEKLPLLRAESAFYLPSRARKRTLFLTLHAQTHTFFGTSLKLQLRMGFLRLARAKVPLALNPSLKALNPSLKTRRQPFTKSPEPFTKNPSTLH